MDELIINLYSKSSGELGGMFYANDLLKAPYTSLSIFITLSTEY